MQKTRRQKHYFVNGIHSKINARPRGAGIVYVKFHYTIKSVLWNWKTADPEKSLRRLVLGLYHYLLYLYHRWFLFIARRAPNTINFLVDFLWSASQT